MADYDVPNTMSRIAALEKRVLQLETSPRLGIFNAVGEASSLGRALIIDDENIWSDFEVTPISITVETSTRALIFFSARPRIILGVSKWQEMDLGVRITNVETGTVIEPDDSSIGTRTLVATTWPGSIDGTDSTLTQVVVQEGLTPGENTFLLMGRYLWVTANAVKPTAISRSLIVVPLDA